MELSQLNIVQQEIVKALEQLGARATFSEAILAKKIRDNTKIENKKKAGIGLSDLEKAVAYLEESNTAFYTIHLNSANDLLITKSETAKPLTGDSRKRRQSSEKAMSIFTCADFSQGRSPVQKKSKKPKHRDYFDED